MGLTGLMVSCGEDRTYQYDELTKGNHSMVGILQESYLWADQMKTDIDWKGYFGSGETFFKKLLYSKDSWSYCTIDTVQADKFARGYFNHLNSYGMDFDVMTDPTGGTNRSYARVLYVATGSEADKAGVQRGDFISFINGNRVATSNASKMVSGDSITLTINHIEYNIEEELLYWADTTEVVLGKSSYVEDYPYFVTAAFNYQSRTIGYMMDTRLIAGPYEKDPQSVEYRDDMDSIFATFKSLGVNELIVDLRYCNRGEMSMVERLASYIAAYHHDGEAFLTSHWRDDLSSHNAEYNYDLSLTNGNALDLSRVTFITSRYTTGPAEWLIHGLQHTLGADNVHIIGLTTAGQNVMTSAVSTDFSMTLYPVVAYVGDATGDYDYSAGIAPTFEVDEASYVHMYNFGGFEEILFFDAVYSLFHSNQEE